MTPVATGPARSEGLVAAQVVVLSGPVADARVGTSAAWTRVKVAAGLRSGFLPAASLVRIRPRRAAVSGLPLFRPRSGRTAL